MQTVRYNPYIPVRVPLFLVRAFKHGTTTDELTFPACEEQSSVVALTFCTTCDVTPPSQPVVRGQTGPGLSSSKQRRA